MSSIRIEDIIYSVESHLLPPFIRSVVDGTEKIMEFADDNVETLGEGKYIKLMNILRDIRRHLSSDDAKQIDRRIPPSQILEQREQGNIQNTGYDMSVINFIGKILTELNKIERHRAVRTLLDIDTTISFSISIKRRENSYYDEPIIYKYELPSIHLKTSRVQITSFRILPKTLLHSTLSTLKDYQDNRDLFVNKTINDVHPDHISNGERLRRSFHDLTYISDCISDPEIYDEIETLILSDQNKADYYKVTRVGTTLYSFNKQFKFYIPVLEDPLLRQSTRIDIDRIDLSIDFNFEYKNMGRAN